MKRLPLCALLLTFACGAFAGEIYTWKDKSGHIHYSDQPPADSSAQLKRGAAPAPASSASSPAEKNRAFKERRATQAEAEQKSADEKKKAEAKHQYCSELKARSDTFESGVRVTHVVGGENVFYTDEERAAIARKARADLAEAKCGN